MSGDGRIEVRSYRTVFDLERRLYRIDRLRLNPGGVPVRGIVYGVVLTVVVAVLAALPLLGWPLRALPWPARHLLLPTLLAAALTVVRVDGRPCHVALRSLIELAVGPRRVDAWERVPRSAERWRPPDLVVIPDGSECRSAPSVLPRPRCGRRQRRARAAPAPRPPRDAAPTPHRRRTGAQGRRPRATESRLDIRPGRER